MKVRTPPWTAWAPVCAVLIVSAFLRFDHLWERGLFYWDEAKFGIEGLRYEQALRHLVGLSAHVSDGKPVGTAKPTHALLFGLAYLVLGFHDYAGLYFDALCSLASVAITYAIGRLLFGARTALIASALLGVSAYEIVYARSDLSESDAALLFLIGFWLWARSTRDPSTASGSHGHRRILPAAVVLSICFTTNYRSIVYIAILVAADLMMALKRLTEGRESPLAVARRVTVWAVGLASALLFWQIVGVVTPQLGVTLFRNEFDGSTRLYLAQALYQIHGGKQAAVGFQPTVYLGWMAARETVGIYVPIILGLWYVARKRTWTLVTVAALAVIPYFAYMFAPFVVPRNLEMAVPFLLLLAAVGIDRLLTDWGKQWRPLVLSGLAVLFVADGILSVRLSSVRSGFASAAAYLRLHANGKVITTSEVPVFYLHATGARCTTPALSLSFNGLSQERAGGFSFVLVDSHHQTAMSRYVVAHASLVARFSTLGTSDLPDDLISSENSSPPPGDSRREYIDVYRLHPRAATVSSRSHSLSCPRDLVT